MRNNVTRLLDAHNIPYQAFELPSQKLSAVEAAHLLGVSPSLVFKTIVIKRTARGKTILALVPGDREVELKALAKALGEKKVQLSTQAEAERLTGLQAGGISPLALLNRGFQVVVDQSAQDSKAIYVSGGQRGLNIRLHLADLLSLTHAETAEISI